MGHSLDLAVKLIEVSVHPAELVYLERSPAQQSRQPPAVSHAGDQKGAVRNRGATAVDAAFQKQVLVARNASPAKLTALARDAPLPFACSATAFKGMSVRAWYPRWLKSACFKVQDAMIDYAYCPQYNAFRYGCRTAAAPPRRHLSTPQRRTKLLQLQMPMHRQRNAESTSHHH